MINVLKLTSLQFNTPRLNVANVSSRLSVAASKSALLYSVVNLFTPAVVQLLPEYFQDIENTKAAQIWFNKMRFNSQVLTINLKSSDTTIGFLFLVDLLCRLMISS